MMTQPVAIDSDEEFRGKRKGKKGTAPMRLAPAPAPGWRAPQPLPGRLPGMLMGAKPVKEHYMAVEVALAD
jgi:hypothetical protein